MNKNKIISGLIGLVYFCLLLLTMPDYNIFWDARNHYFKGQAFINFFLHGRKDYEGLPVSKDYARYHRDYVSKYSPDPKISEKISNEPNYRRSIYQDDVHTFDWLIKSDQIEHPVFSDNMSALSNIVFYEKLGWLRDDYSYRVYTLVLASVLVAVVFYWSFVLFGFIPGVISMLVLATTPLFWAESHFNLKDVPQMAFFSLAIWQIWKGVVSQSKKAIIFSAFFAAFAFSTKLNIVFLPFILIPWFIFFYLNQSKKNKKAYRSWIWFILIYPLIMLGIFYISWPQMWSDPIGGFTKVIGIYSQVGIAPDYTPNFRTIFNFSSYAVIWITLTTYPWVLIMSLIGIIISCLNFRRSKDYLPLLFLLWFIVPIIRASLPFTSIFGGVRHIMEYIPALAMMAGYGAFNLLKFFPRKAKPIIGLILILGFIPLIFTLIRLHPAENVYFNSLIGGLSGAKKTNITGWGYNDGGIYRKATDWLNQNAKIGSHVATAFSEPADFYIPELRHDLFADNLFSGFLQKGEYIVALTHDTGLEHTYRMQYPETFLDPVYVYSVDSVPLIKIWKNEKKYLKKEFTGLRNESLDILPEKIDDNLRWNLKGKKRVIAVDIEYEKDSSCKDLASGIFQISDDSENWDILPETYPGGVLSFLGDQPNGNKLVAPIAGRIASYISFIVEPKDACLFNVKNSKIMILTD